MINNNSEYKYETPYKGSFVITQCWTNGTTKKKYDPIKIRHSISWIKLYKSNTKAEYINHKIMCDDVNT